MDPLTLSSTRGRIVRASVLTVTVAFLVLLFLFRDAGMALTAILLVVWALLEAFVWLFPRLFRYTFHDDRLEVRVTGSWDEPPIFYDKVWKVVDTDHAPLGMNTQGASSDAIQIWYDRGTGHFVCISPDKSVAMPILREMCTGAEFVEDRRSADQ